MNIQKLCESASILNIDLSHERAQILLEYLALLVRWNRAFNLTAIQQPEEMLVKHIYDSLAVVPYIQRAHGKRFIDVGSGAGLPGVVLAVVSPDQLWTLLDSNGKKTRFLLQVVATLGLKNVEVVHSRVEMFSPADCFDGVITRAWTSLEKILADTRHLCCKNGIVWAMKGKYPAQELSEINIPYHVHKLIVPELNEERHLVEVKFTKNRLTL